jgi:hypothetical protein
VVHLSIKESRTAQGAFSSIGSKKSGSDQEHYKRTVARIESIQSHISKSPRRMRLKDKVCVITGVGSMKGIGYGCLNCPSHSLALLTFVKHADELQRYYTPTKVHIPTDQTLTCNLKVQINVRCPTSVLVGLFSREFTQPEIDYRKGVPGRQGRFVYGSLLGSSVTRNAGHDYPGRCSG